MGGLPHQIRQEEQTGDETAQPEPARAEIAPLRRQQQPDDDPGTQEQDRVFGQQTEAGDQAEGHPEACVVGLQQANEQVQPEHPGQLIEGDGLEERVGHQVDR